MSNKEDYIFYKAYSKLSDIVSKYIDLNVSRRLLDKYLSEVIDYEEYSLYYSVCDRNLARNIVIDALNIITKERHCNVLLDYYIYYANGRTSEAIKVYVT